MSDQLPEPTPRLGLPRRAAPAGRRPTTEQRAPEHDPEALALARRIVDLAEDKKASDIMLLDIGRLTSMADYFVICSGASERQLGAIADGITSGLRDDGVRPIGREGSASAHWLLIDYGSVIVHVMAPPEREFYQLERLWADAPLLLRLQ
ncbi:MAG: ribosome silencing factor [Chloroflexota bacterium]|nr:ribosome silencing factor [Chloroflexota bacterium]